jgi:hypothetical protein
VHIDGARTRERAAVAATKLLAYCRANDWAGYDPYDALNSRLFKAFPIFDSKLPRLLLTQALKRSPVDIRRFVLIPKTQNPKGLALFLVSALKLSHLGLLDDPRTIETLIEGILASRSPDTASWCWGYSFPWQTRTEVVPQGAPNLVCTTFVVNALLDAYDASPDPRLLEIGTSAADFIVNELYWSNGEEAGFSYPMSGHRTKIHNANFLAAALLCRIHRLASRPHLVEHALRAARYSARMQRPDGSWPYGELPKQVWIDNFHTGYNLGALRSIARDAATVEFDEHIRRGHAFYREHFFREDGAPRYFHDNTYPIDVHCVAQSLITLCEFQDLDERNATLAWSVFDWAMMHMWDERGFFYYRILRLCTIRTSYMRWSQAWMLLALTTLLADSSKAGHARVESAAVPGSA